MNAPDGDAGCLSPIGWSIEVRRTQSHLDEREQCRETRIGPARRLTGDQQQRSFAPRPSLDEKSLRAESIERRTAVGGDHPVTDRNNHLTGRRRRRLDAYGHLLDAERRQVGAEIARAVLDVQRLRGVDRDRDPLE